MKNDLINLISTLTKAEKRQFKLSLKKYKSTSVYVFLLDILEKNKYTNWDEIKTEFKTRHPKASIDSASNYLYKLLMDTIITNRVNNNEYFKLLYSLLQIKVLQERNLPDSAFIEIKKNQMLASKYQQTSIQYLLMREELNHLSKSNFNSIKEKELLSTQIAAKDILKEIRNTHEHHTLYEILKYRLSNTSEIISEQSKQRLTDLVLNEIAIINTSTKQSLESKKIHLLFQSFYFIKTGDYKSALRTFYILNELYENKLLSIQDPPFDYFSMLDGILESLRMIDNYQEMEYYSLRMEQLDRQGYPDFFRLMVKKSILLSRLWILSSSKNWEEIINIIRQTDAEILEINHVVPVQKQMEIFFYTALSYYHTEQPTKAVKQLNKIILGKNILYASPVYRMARLLNIILYYESRDLDYLDYELRSYKRIFKGSIKMLVLEKLIFRIIHFDPVKQSKYSKKEEWKSLAKNIQSIHTNKSESKLAKYFDFISWTKGIFAME